MHKLNIENSNCKKYEQNGTGHFLLFNLMEKEEEK